MKNKYDVTPILELKKIYQEKIDKLTSEFCEKTEEIVKSQHHPQDWFSVGNGACFYGRYKNKEEFEKKIQLKDKKHRYIVEGVEELAAELGYMQYSDYFTGHGGCIIDIEPKFEY